MRVWNLGSINVDHVYAVERIARPGETIPSGDYHRFAGGKGFNQSIALARAGAEVAHVGVIGTDGGWLRAMLQREGVDVTHLRTAEVATGHAIIQVERTGENAIVLHAGANACLAASDLAGALAGARPGDGVLLQNETSHVAEILQRAAQAGLRVAFNPAPMTSAVAAYPLDRVDLFLVNETEAEALTGESEPLRAGESLRRRFPRAAVVLTLGARGAVFVGRDGRWEQPAPHVQTVDTTAAGDTFTGYFLTEWLHSGNAEAALRLGCAAAAVCVTRPGAADSIPRRAELGDAGTAAPH